MITLRAAALGVVISSGIPAAMRHRWRNWPRGVVSSLYAPSILVRVRVRVGVKVRVRVRIQEG
eukprot:scaffold77251_cov49-Phaeocystis_antarctica.AAC.1